MQLTRLDRWLKEKFVYEIQILTLRRAEDLPKGIRETELPDKVGRRFKFLYQTNRSKAAETLLTNLKENNQMFSTKVVDKDAWFVQFVAPEAKSVTWYLVSVFVLMGAFTPVVIWMRSLLNNPEFMKNLEGAKEILKG
ncbi:MAG: hypothetical protein AB8D78_09045 [Akkermansiaceae bacterium]